MNRSEAVARLQGSRETWDIVVVGGGATGLGVAVDAASRGYRTALVEAEDFAKGTSSRSTKLIHGGVRYLRQGNLRLIRAALRERARLLRNAPHLVEEIRFVVPAWRRRDLARLRVGLAAYDLLAGTDRLAPSRRLDPAETRAAVPTVRAEGLRGSIVYHDARFDDARLAIHLARTAVREGATVANRLAAVAFARRDGAAVLQVEDREAGERFELRARAVVNAGGPFADEVRRLADPGGAPMLQVSRGTHVVLDRRVLPGDSALLLPDVGSGRVVFLVPWRDRILLGTTDVPVPAPVTEPRASRRELEELLGLAARVLVRAPTEKDVHGTFAGLRPLIRGRGDTASLRRDHVVRLERSGLVTVAGGKWTTYRLMAEDAVDRAARAAGLPPRRCRTADLPIDDTLPPRGGVPVGPGAEVTAEDVRWAAREEMARTVEDVLARRTGALVRDARVAAALAPAVAQELAKELGRDAAWERNQVESFERLAAACRPGGLS